MTLALLSLGFSGIAQEELVNCTDSFCIPGVEGVPRSKVIVFRRESVLNYGIQSEAQSDQVQSGRAEVENNRRYDFKFRAPLYMSKGLSVILGANYFVEEYRFEDANNLEYPLYQRLEDKSLKKLAGNLYVSKPFKGNKYLLGRGSISLNGDYTTLDLSRKEFMRGSVALLYGIKRKPNLSYAFGAAFGYNFGRRVAYPIFAYSHAINSKWGLDLLLPVKAKVRYHINPKTLAFFSTELNGANYNISFDNPLVPGVTSYHLEKTEIRYLASIEREVHDWLWVGMEAGFRTNFELSLTQVEGLDRTLYVRNNLNEAFLFNFSIFAVVPRKFSNR